ncbi:universal stress protein [Arthrobacter sp. H41]|uniref:universal stress protein n=1 Tax=Arthrobacter sp. H41 TaxID=1312978 RepID=UPI0004797DFC|nr:universal stress protein [Arthrobacter sp. H41]
MSVVVGYIPTPEGRAALQRAIEESRLRKLKLVVVNSRDSGRQASGQEKAQYETELKEMEKSVADAGVEYEIRTMARGTLPSEDLTAVAEETRAELIVIGMRRRSPVGKLFLGSNAQEVLLSADCAVLSVKASK